MHTLNELNNNGFKIVLAWDVINNKFDIEATNKCVITIYESELPRDDGDDRCMTMPLRIKNV